MAKKKKALGTNQLLTCLGALVAVVLAVVGLFVPYFTRTAKSSLLGSSNSASYGLFDQVVTDLGDGADTSATLVRIMAIAAVVLAAIAAIAAILIALRIVKGGGLIKFVFAAATIVVGVLALVFTFTFAGQFALDGGALAEYAWSAGVGAYLLGIGSILGGATLLLAK